MREVHVKRAAYIALGGSSRSGDVYSREMPYDYKKHIKGPGSPMSRIEKMLYAKYKELDDRVKALEDGETVSERRERLGIEEASRKESLVQDLRDREDKLLVERADKAKAAGEKQWTTDVDDDKPDTGATERWLRGQVKS